MNGRVYDPLLGMFLSPDNYVQDPSASQSFNRYAYCMNNPLKYTDPDGNYAIIDDIIAGAVGGIGAIYPEFGGWIWGGAAVGATNAWLGGGDIGMGACVGAIAGVAGGAAGQWGGQYIGSVIINGTQVTSPVLQGAITGTVGGAFGGYVGGFAGGLIMTGDVRQANRVGINGLWTGATVGGVVGAGAGYKYAVDNKINPWNGDLKFVQTQQYDFTPDKYGDNVTLYRGTTGSEGNGGPLFMTDNPDYA
jgi:hypothetical protein